MPIIVLRGEIFRQWQVEAQRAGSFIESVIDSTNQLRSHLRYTADHQMIDQPCNVCQKEASKCCGGCRQVFYCGKDHQKLDWIRHKITCKPYKVCEDEVLGRHLVASRDIRAGEVVLREHPLLQGPCQVTGPVCLECLQSISQHNSEPCDLCGWPLCRRPACRQGKRHRPECRWTVEKRKTPVKISQFINPHPTYECVTALRLCYARQNEPGVWARLSSLQTHTDERRKSPKYQEDSKSVAQFLRRFYKLESELTEEEIMDIWGVVQVNGHEVPVTQPSHVAVYDTSSMLEHSCHPNCAKSFTDKGAIVVRAVTDIPQGCHISICYTDCMWGTVNRQFHLADTKYFTCQCARCVDPTELATFYSALLCTNGGCGGPVLPEDLCSVTSRTLWTCRVCGHSETDDEVGALLQRTGQELTTLACQGVGATESFLDRWRHRYHQNHYYLTEARLALCQRLGQENVLGVRGLTDDHLHLKIDLCHRLLELLSIVAPAEVRVLGTLNFELHASLAEQARREHASGKGEDLQVILLESRKCLYNTIELLEQEPQVLPEGQLLVQAKLNKLELDKTLQCMM